MRKHSRSSSSHTLIAWKFNNEADRLSGTLPSTAVVTFVEADLGRRAYDIDTMTFWDISEVVAGVPTWVAATGFSLEEIVNLIGITEVPTQKLNSVNFKIANTDFVQRLLATFLQRKQDTLVSGTNIKTINGETLLGTGNITITTSDPALNVAKFHLFS